MDGVTSGENSRVLSTPAVQGAWPVVRQKQSIALRQYQYQDDGQTGSPCAVFIDAGNGKALSRPTADSFNAKNFMCNVDA